MHNHLTTYETVTFFRIYFYNGKCIDCHFVPLSIANIVNKYIHYHCKDVFEKNVSFMHS